MASRQILYMCNHRLGAHRSLLSPPSKASPITLALLLLLKVSKHRRSLSFFPAPTTTINLFPSLLSRPGLVSMATPFELAALGYVRVWRVHGCVGREACSKHKTKGLFCPRFPPGQLVTGAAGELRARERGKRERAR